MNAKNFLCSLALSFLINMVPAFSQQKAPRLIVRADDMGFAHGANMAIMKTLKEGIATSVEVLVPSPWFPEAVALLNEHPSIDVGVHLTLTSEWSNMKYRPVSKAPSLINEDGYFYPFIWKNKRMPGQALTEHEWSIKDIEQEFRAQIALAQKKLPQISHITAHMGCYEMTEEVSSLAKELAKEYKIDIYPVDYQVSKVTYLGPKGTSEEKVQSIIRMLESLKPRETYFFVDHPALDTPELRAIHHPGYFDVAIDRQGVTDAWTDQRVKEAIRKLGIQLISYKDLRK